MHGAIFDKKKCKKKCIMLKLVIDYGYCLDLLTISLENSRVFCGFPHIKQWTIDWLRFLLSEHEQ